ncbi:MAG: hypothetical protein JXL84_07195 [Deltaproteobacteria bacterium]|nr:hypothetical protein [Deltaproteobacteria bacterium]
MEVRESAACGISQREFTIDFDTEELPDIYRVFRYAQDGTGFYDEDFLEDLKSQMSYIIGPSLQEDAPEAVEEGILHWEDEGGSFHLILNEEESRKLREILSGVDHPGEGFDRDLLQRLMDQMMELAPSILQNLPVINR